MSPPVRARGLVSRSDLPEWYARSAPAKLVLLRAPAGYGKTTVLLQWMELAEEGGKRTAWLTLDKADNDPARFLAYLRASFSMLYPSLALTFDTGANPMGGPVAATLLPDLLERVSSTEIPFLLFIDEFEAVRNSEVHDILRRLIEAVPPGCQVAIATRETPEIPLARMRAREQVFEIGAARLRFSVKEAERFLDREGGPRLDREDVAHLRECTEGWATGLQLAKLALAGRKDIQGFVRSFSGSFADIADYLWEEVVGRQPERVRDFLLKTSILERLSGPLCDAVTGTEGGYETLASLERANLFVTALDDERRWYRYHNLFAQFLRGRLLRGFEDRVAALHAAAADWFEKRGGYEAAAEHALAAGDGERAAALMGRCARTLVTLGQMDTVLRWAERLPRGAVETQPELWVALCWALVFRRRDHEEARRNIASLCESGMYLKDPKVRDEALALQGVVLSFTDEVEEVSRVCAENLARISDCGSFAFAALSDALAASLMWVGKFAEAEQCWTRVRQNQGPAERSILTVYRDSVQTSVWMIQGRLQEALSMRRLTYSRAAEAFPTDSLPRAVAGVTLAELLIEVDELDEAQGLLDEYLAVVREYRPLDPAVIAYLALSRIYLRRGKEREVERLLDEADRLGRSAGVPSVSPAIQSQRIRLALRQGDVNRAERELAELCRNETCLKSRAVAVCEPDTPEVLRLKMMVAKGLPNQALSGMRSLLTTVESAGRLRQALTLRILEAEALDAAGQRMPALRVLKHALQFGCREGFIRPFIEEGAVVLRLVGALRETHFEMEEDPILGDIPPSYLDRILSAAGAPAPAPEEPTGAVDALTKRELEVLRLASLGLSNQETADRLFVSLATAKFHMANIAVKLGTRNRREAILKGRRLGLLKS